MLKLLHKMMLSQMNLTWLSYDASSRVIMCMACFNVCDISVDVCLLQQLTPSFLFFTCDFWLAFVFYTLHLLIHTFFYQFIYMSG